jgi:cell division protein FtsA
VPQNVAGLLDVRDNPSYATGVGLLLHGQTTAQAPVHFNLTRGRGILSRMKEWFAGNF